MNNAGTLTFADAEPCQAMPSKWLTLAELPRAAANILSLPLQLPRLLSAPRGDGRTVLVIPGFGAADGSTAALRRYLSYLGYHVVGWGLGRNLGARTIGIHNERLIDTLERTARTAHGKVSLIGWSMGGIMVRMISRDCPQSVRQIITLGAPFTGNPYANNAWQIYERLSGHSLSHPVARAQIRESKLVPPVRSTAIYSRSDGVVSWQCCLEPAASHTRNIEISSAHCGFGFNAVALRTVAEVLAST